MNTLNNTINVNYLSALKSRDKRATTLLSSLRASIKNLQIAKRAELNDVEVITLLRKEIKKREDSIELYNKGNRSDLSDIEKNEIDILSSYLPAEVTDEDLTKAVKQVISDLNATSKKQMGQVIKALVEKFAGAVDNRRISQKVGELLA